MYNSHAFLPLVALTHFVTHTTSAPSNTRIYSAISPQQNTSILTPSLTLPQNSTTPLTFLGTECYHLLPDTVSLLQCQDLFAKMLQIGNPYEDHEWWNGWQFRTGFHGPCTITLSNPDDKARVVKMSVADVMGYAHEVLEDCQSTGSGGANTFQGDWRVQVTKFPVKRDGLGDGVSTE